MFRIVTAQDADRAALDGLVERLGHVKAPDYFARCLSEQAQGHREIFLILPAGDTAAIGYGMLNWKPRYALYRRLGIPEIQDINVLRELRRQGAARMLIAHCEDIAQARGCAMIGISVGLYADYGAAQRLYVKLGYVPDGYGVTYDREFVVPGEIRPVDDDLCLMLVKDLAP